MIITKDMLEEKVPKEMMPTRLDSALILYTNIRYKNESGIIVYNTNPTTWNCLYPFYELNHKFTIDDYKFLKEDITYKELIEEYQRVYKEKYETKAGNTKEVRMNILIDEYKKTFNLLDVNISDELLPIFELKYSKSKNVWTLYYFENYVANKVDNINTLFEQKLYDQKILPLDSSIKAIDSIEVASNIPYMLSIDENVKLLNKSIIDLEP
ncbi:MAG: hypothetical protein IJO33_04245 [Bacilli bacterium]|nr:hypothetical protein [Bacilli bacterium]